MKLKFSPKQWWEQGTQAWQSWFDVSPERLTEILAQVRESLPTTEVVLIGKPQAGKSSIARALTGASSEIVGPGFRPHTRHTQQYAFPTEELPLLLFTDTVGLGETQGDTDAVLADLDQQLTQAKTAQLLLLTVKVSDFATDTLHRIARDLKQRFPHIPCLLVITCLHELYPPSQENHPPYPPTFSELEPAITALQAQFADITPHTVVVDFTLEEDGFEPVFYGLAALGETLESLLPEAEAGIIHQLLDDKAIAEQLGTVYRSVGRRSILPFAIMAATLAIVPFPFATMPVLIAIQTTMVVLIGRLYGQTLSPSQAGGILTTIGGGFLARLVGQQLIKFIPVLGNVLSASWSFAYTWALGEGACVYFGDLMGGKKPNPARIREAMQTSFQEAQAHFRQSWKSQAPLQSNGEAINPGHGNTGNGRNGETSVV